MTVPECSIVIVNYHQLDLINNCIDSILAHTIDVDLEIIVVDNDSNDNNIDRLKEKSSCIRIIKNFENAGIAIANNQGARCATGKYILYLDNDTIFTENSIRKVINYAESSKEELIIGVKLLYSDGSPQIALVDFDGIINSFSESLFIYKLFPKSKLFNKYYQNYINATEHSSAEALKGCFMFCSSKLLKKLDYLDERFDFYMDDTDICYRFVQNGGKVIYFPGTSIIHLGGASSDKHQWFKYKNQTISKIKFYQKHFTGGKFLLLVSSHYIGVFLRVFAYLLQGALILKKSLFIKSFYYFRQLFVYPKNIFN